MRWHLVPISDQTHSKIPFRLWMERIMVRRVNHQHRTKGWLFETRAGVRAKFGVYDSTFRLLVALARAKNPRLVPSVIELEDFSLWRSPRRGAVLETTHRGIDSKVMELINRWRSKEAAKGSVPNLTCPFDRCIRRCGAHSPRCSCTPEPCDREGERRQVILCRGGFPILNYHFRT